MPTLPTRTLLFSLLLLISALFVGNRSARAQSPAGLDPCTGGTLYYIAYPDTVVNWQDSRFVDTRKSEFFLYIYSPVSQQVKIGRANGSGLARNIGAGEILEFDTREIAVPIITVRNFPQSNILKVESESPVVVYAYMATPFGCAAFTPIPVESWGTQYFAATWPGEYVRDISPAGENNFDASVKVAAPAEILVIAAYDNTQLRISPTAPLAACANCQTVKLNRGEAYLVQSFVDLMDTTDRVQGDIAGSSISATKPIGVITANTRSWHDPFPDGFLAANSYKDMTAEWLTPVEQHGKEFVFTPTWDGYRQRPNDSPVRENEYVRIYATGSNATDVTLRSEVGERLVVRGIKGGEFADERLDSLGRGYFYYTSKSAQALQSPRATTEFNTVGCSAFIGAHYRASGTYAVEMTPREQWTSFAPFKAPSYPSNMKHYINLVTDSADQYNVYYRSGSDTLQPFPFTRGTIPTPSGTLVWGQMVVNSGVNYTVEGKCGARFGGFVYGNTQGYELFGPSVAKDGDVKEKSTAAAHPAEYEEALAMMYAYPLASSSCVLRPTDEYRVRVEQNCDEMEITIDAENQNPSGLEFIRLLDDPDSTSNTRLEFIEPESASVLPEKNIANATIRLVASNPLQDARGVVEFKDRTREGKVERVRFKYEAERVDIVPAKGLDFGKLTLNFAAGERELTITNPLDKDVVVKELKFFFGNQEFVITRVNPNFDWKSGKDSIILKSEESMRVWIDITPRNANRIYHDSLIVILGCVQVSVPLDAATVQPCLFVNDLDFGTLTPKDSKTLELEVCNIGKGRVTFHDSASRGGGNILSWLLTNKFTVDQADIDKLKNTVLNANECVKINVTFSSDETGTFRTVGRFWASTRDCRDTSIWRANVVNSGPQITNYDWGARWVTSRNTCTKNDTVQYIEGIAPEYKGGVITIGNNGTAPYMIRGLEIINDDPNDPADIFVIDNPGNVVNGRIINPGVTENLIVAFRPAIEKEYSAVIRLNYRSNGKDGFIDGTLRGSGIESCLQINDLTIIADSTVTPPKGTRRLLLRSVGGRAVTVTSISLSGIDAPDFVYEGGLPALPIVIPPGESYPLSLTFLPSTLPAGERRAELAVEGDYAYVDCPGSCSDSLAELTGKLGTLTVAGEEALAGYAIRSVTPNPFSREVQIEFELGESGETRVEVFDPTGQSVGVLLEARLTKGIHSVDWDGGGLSSGAYFIRITSGAWSTSQQVLFVR